MPAPAYIMSAAPMQATQFVNFFDSGDDSVMNLLANPGEFRYAGWDLQTLDRPRITNGEYLEVSNGERKQIQLYEDGTLIARVNADSSFLGWGRSPNEFALKPRLNPLSSIEVTTAFVHLYRKLLDRLSPQPQDIKFRLEFKDAMVNGRKLYMTPYGLNTTAWMFDDERYEISQSDIFKEISFTSDLIRNDQDHVAYKLVERFYLFFNIPTDKIPYVTKDNNSRRVDVQSFSKRP